MAFYNVEGLEITPPQGRRSLIHLPKNLTSGYHLGNNFLNSASVYIVALKCFQDYYPTSVALLPNYIGHGLSINQTGWAFTKFFRAYSYIKSLICCIMSWLLLKIFCILVGRKITLILQLDSEWFDHCLLTLDSCEPSSMCPS